MVWTPAICPLIALITSDLATPAECSLIPPVNIDLTTPAECSLIAPVNIDLTTPAECSLISSITSDLNTPVEYSDPTNNHWCDHPCRTLSDPTNNHWRLSLCLPANTHRGRAPELDRPSDAYMMRIPLTKYSALQVDLCNGQRDARGLWVYRVSHQSKRATARRDARGLWHHFLCFSLIWVGGKILKLKSANLNESADSKQHCSCVARTKFTSVWDFWPHTCSWHSSSLYVSQS